MIEDLRLNGASNNETLDRKIKTLETEISQLKLRISEMAANEEKLQTIVKGLNSEIDSL